MSWSSPLGGGNPGAFTCSVFRLDPTGTVPVEPLFDLLPGITPLRVTLDMIDSESIALEYDVTEHTIQGALDVTSNIRKRLETLSIVGTLTAQFQPMLTPFIPGIPGPQATPPIFPAVPFQPAMPAMPPFFVQLDLLRFENLKAIADDRRPVMVVTPRITLPRAAIVSLNADYSPDLGDSLSVSLTFREVRLVSPISAEAVIDYPAQAPGANVEASSGSTAKATSATVSPSTSPGVGPSVGASAGGAP